MKKTVRILAIVIVFVLIAALLQRLLTPKYMTDLIEGSMVSQYYGEYGDHDVIFLGDCEVYSNYSPLKMFEDYGITAYIRGSSQQLIWQSYYILKETLRYETPKVVIFNVNSMRYSEPVSEAYNRLTIDRMRWSSEKIGIIKASMTEEESFLSYVFPILRYHSRFDKLTGEDIEYLYRTKDNTFEGYLLNMETRPVGDLPAKRPPKNYAFAEICYDYLDRMEELCRENGIKLVLVKSPCLYPYWYEEYDEQISSYAGEHGLIYYDLTKARDEIGLDFSTDTYDGGVHLNLYGAEKLSAYISEKLRDDLGLTDHRGEADIEARYIEKLKEYHKATEGEK
ncbi:MAG: SGNH/GDSL hydrolase family protein [Clostridia bacterium]|nr:SGNH/GDSL hydrolase family protein [Clostridia bacterium]